MSDEHSLNGRIQSVGRADCFFTAEQLDEGGLSPEDRLLIVVVDRDDPGRIPMGVAWAKSVRIGLRENP